GVAGSGQRRAVSVGTGTRSPRKRAISGVSGRYAAVPICGITGRYVGLCVGTGPDQQISLIPGPPFAAKVCRVGGTGSDEPGLDKNSLRGRVAVRRGSPERAHPVTR